MLLMALPNELLMTINQYKGAKSLFDAITIRFGVNNATKKTHKTLLKQMYENFSAQSTESLDSIFNRLQKIVSQLARNKSDLDKISIDDLYNNFKIVKQEVKRNAGPSSSSGSQNMAFVSTLSTSNNDDVSTIFGVSNASPQVSTTNLSDATMYAFLANQPNRSELMHEDLEQIHKDEEASLDKKDSPKHRRVIEEIDEDKNVNLVKISKQYEAHETAGHRMESDDTEVVDFSTASLQKDNDEITLAETLISLDEEIAQRFYKEEQAQLLMYEEYDQQVQAQWMMVIIPEQGIHVEAFQTREDLVKLWSLVKEMFGSSNPTKDKEIALWVELKRLFELDEDVELWKSEFFELIWRLYDWCEVYHISTRDAHDIFMLVEKEYPLSRGALLMMLVQKLQVDEHNEMAEELLRKIFMQAERPRKNKLELDKISIDDLYNNFKIIKQEVKRNAGPSTSFCSQNMAFILTSSTNNNDDVSIIFGVSTASPQVSTTNLNDATVYAFLTNQPNRSELMHEDLEQIYEDEEASLDKEDSPKQGMMIKEIDKDENVNLVKSNKQREAHETAGHKMKSDDTEVVDFSTTSLQKDDDEITLTETLLISKEVTRNQENITRNQETTRRTVNVEDTSSKAMVAIDEAGFD
nr:hypothetical protein [Tanacetum cinerariifolium]